VNASRNDVGASAGKITRLSSQAAPSGGAAVSGTTDARSLGTQVTAYSEPSRRANANTESARRPAV
jgi:hypothetical protein